MRWLMAAALPLACSCAAEQNHVVPTCSYGRPCEDPIDVFVRDVLTSDRMYEEQECFWIAATMKGWDDAQLLCATRTALSYVKPEYAEGVHHRVMTFVNWCEMDRGVPELRRWLRQHIGEDDEIAVQVLESFTSFGAANEVPELFDLFSRWVKWGRSSPRVGQWTALPGVPTLEWRACDQGAEGLWLKFFECIPEAARWRHYGSSQDNAMLQKEWRERMPAWLEAHPEARSYWIQRYYHSLRGRRKCYSGNTKTLQRAEAVAKAIEAYEREFAFELTDRRGICAEAPWNQDE